MVNALVHEISTEMSFTVETVEQLKDALRNTSEVEEDLDSTYVVELIREVLSDKSVKYSVRIREAEAV